MFGYCTVFGIDSHARTTTVCAVDVSTGEVRARTFRGNPYGEMAEWMAGFPQPSYGVYEAGCTGFVPARELSAEGRRVVPIATSHIPTSPDDRSRKTDRRDAERLARLALSGQAVEVWVPDGQTEGLRDLSRAIEDAAERRERCRMQVDAILLRHGYVWDRKTPQGRPVKRWGALHAQWLRGVRLADPASQAAYQAALEAEALGLGVLRRAGGEGPGGGVLVGPGPGRGRGAVAQGGGVRVRPGLLRRGGRLLALRLGPQGDLLLRAGPLGALERRRPALRRPHEGRLPHRQEAARRVRLAPLRPGQPPVHEARALRGRGGGRPPRGQGVAPAHRAQGLDAGARGVRQQGQRGDGRRDGPLDVGPGGDGPGRLRRPARPLRGARITDAPAARGGRGA